MRRPTGQCLQPSRDAPRSPRDASDTGKTPEACYDGPDKTSACLTDGADHAKRVFTLVREAIEKADIVYK